MGRTRDKSTVFWPLWPRVTRREIKIGTVSPRVGCFGRAPEDAPDWDEKLQEEPRIQRITRMKRPQVHLSSHSSHLAGPIRAIRAIRGFL
jgi:hypothetical protein